MDGTVIINRMIGFNSGGNTHSPFAATTAQRSITQDAQQPRIRQRRVQREERQSVKRTRLLPERNDHHDRKRHNRRNP
jgi:hypothetical protein